MNGGAKYVITEQAEIKANPLVKYALRERADIGDAYFNYGRDSEDIVITIEDLIKLLRGK